MDAQEFSLSACSTDGFFKFLTQHSFMIRSNLSMFTVSEVLPQALNGSNDYSQMISVTLPEKLNVLLFKDSL